MTTPRRFFTRPRLWGLLCGLTLAVAQLFTGAGMSTAFAAPVCTTSGTTVTCTYTYTGAAETFTVPAGVASVRIVARGAAGAAGFQYSPTDALGGQGAEVSADLTVSPNQSLVLVVGGAPTSGNCGDIRCIGGFNGGGSSVAGGGGGGGASDVRVGGSGLAQRVLVAAGGGGGGASASCHVVIAGGKGGNAGTAGTAGQGCYGLGDDGGGKPGSQRAGGVGGTPEGGNGTLATGGNGGYYGGGGGGGGYYGGGGGGIVVSNLSSDEIAAGGGGGGSNLVPNGGTARLTTQPAAIIVSYTLPDTTPPVANPTHSPPPAPSGWNNTNVTVTWNWIDPATGYTTGIDAANCTTSSVSSGAGRVTVTATCKDRAGNTGTATYQALVDPSAPVAHPSQSPAANAAGWNNTDVTVNWNWAFTGAVIDTANCTTSSVSSGEGALTLSAICKDVALNQRTATYAVKVDKSAPAVAVTGVTAGASYPLGSVPTVACSTTDGVSGIATQATLSVTGGNPDGTGNFTATCSGATDLAGNSAAAVSVAYTITPPPSPTPTNTPVPPTATPTIAPTVTPTPAGDACTATALRDDFNRADGSLGSNWVGQTDLSFYKITSNQMDVQLGGPVLWQPTTFGVDQAAFVTLSNLDLLSTAQGVLLKAQEGVVPNAGAISVVYDSLARAVRVSTIQPSSIVWTAYPNIPATFANLDKLIGCVQADGTVRVYQNTTLLATVTLSAADQSFFNTKGGKIGLWTVTALNAIFDDFGGGALPGVTGAAVGGSAVPAEQANTKSAITVDRVLITASLPVSAPAVATTPVVANTPAVTTTQPVTTASGAPAAPNVPAAPNTTEQNQRLFLPIITKLAGAALGRPGGVAVLVLIVLVIGGIVWQRRRSRTVR
ncbi:MAG: glycine-rich protein [Caldilineaceae bacterium]